MFLTKSFLKICNKFTGESPCRSVISIKLQSNFIEIAHRYGRSPVNLLHFSEHLWRAAFVANSWNQIKHFSHTSSPVKNGLNNWLLYWKLPLTMTLCLLLFKTLIVLVWYLEEGSHPKPLSMVMRGQPLHFLTYFTPWQAYIQTEKILTTLLLHISTPLNDSDWMRAWSKRANSSHKYPFLAFFWLLGCLRLKRNWTKIAPPFTPWYVSQSNKFRNDT